MFRSLWYLINDDEAYAAKAFWVAHYEISYDTCIDWGYIIIIQTRIMDDCGWPFDDVYNTYMFLTWWSS